MTDRRQAARRPVRYVVLRSPVPGEVLDLSAVGMRVETSKALTVGYSAWFTIGEEQRCVRLRGEVRWCRLLGTRATVEGEVVPVFRGGIVFLGIHGEPAAAGP